MFPALYEVLGSLREWVKSTHCSKCYCRNLNKILPERQVVMHIMLWQQWVVVVGGASHHGSLLDMVFEVSTG